MSLLYGVTLSPAIFFFFKYYRRHPGEGKLTLSGFDLFFFKQTISSLVLTAKSDQVCSNALIFFFDTARINLNKAIQCYKESQLNPGKWDEFFPLNL